MDRYIYIYTFPSSNGWVSDGLQFARGLLVKLCWQDWLEKNYIRLEHVNVQLNTKHKSFFSFKLERLAFANWWNRLHSLVCQNKGSVYSKKQTSCFVKNSKKTQTLKGNKRLERTKEEEKPCHRRLHPNHVCFVNYISRIAEAIIWIVPSFLRWLNYVMLLYMIFAIDFLFKSTNHDFIYFFYYDSVFAA